MFHLLSVEQTFSEAQMGGRKLCGCAETDYQNRSSEKLDKMTVRLRETLMMNVNMKAVMKNENNSNENTFFDTTTFLFVCVISNVLLRLRSLSFSKIRGD